MTGPRDLPTTASQLLDLASEAVRQTAHHPLPDDPAEIADYVATSRELIERLDGAVRRLGERVDRIDSDAVRSDDGLDPAVHLITAGGRLLRAALALAEVADLLRIAHNAAARLGLPLAERHADDAMRGDR